MHTIKGAWSIPTFALVTCNDSRGRKARTRRSKEERKAMVETFIKTYQKSNDDKFPSINLTQKEVGGTFYTVREVVREIIQENRVLGPAKSHPEEQTDQICAEQNPLGSLRTESNTAFSSTSEVHVITDAEPNLDRSTSGEIVSASRSHFHGADNSLDNGNFASARNERIQGNEDCEELATYDVAHSCNENIQGEQVLHPHKEFAVSYSEKLQVEETLVRAESIEKDDNSSKSGVLTNASLHQQFTTENQVQYPSVNVSEACNQSLNERIVDGNGPRVEKELASREKVNAESLVQEITDEDSDRIEEASKSADVVGERLQLQATSTIIDHYDGKLSETTGDASHETIRKQDNGSNSENCSGLVNEQVDSILEGPASKVDANVVKKETLPESGELPLPISNSSSNKAANDTKSAVVKTSNGYSSNSSHTTSVTKPNVQQSRKNHSGTRKSTIGKSEKQETNPLLALLKTFITAFVKFWTEE